MNKNTEESTFEKILNKRLNRGKFRYINEKLYKNKKLSKNEVAIYSNIYEDQVSQWPNDPNKIIYKQVDEIIGEDTLIADIGCGNTKKHSKNHFLYDKFPSNEDIIKTDMTTIPAQTDFFDIVVCSLSLMCENITRPIKEINRILKVNGIFFLAEVKSRISSVNMLVRKFEKHGFQPEYVNTSELCFVVIKFIKRKTVYENKKLPVIKLKPCLYKRK